MKAPSDLSSSSSSDETLVQSFNDLSLEKTGGKSIQEVENATKDTSPARRIKSSPSHKSPNKIKIDYCIARIFSFYDKNQKPPFLYANIKQRIEEEDLTKPFFISGGNSKRDFLTAKQVSKIIFKRFKHQGYYLNHQR